MNTNEKESPKIEGEQEYERAIYLINFGNLKESIPLFNTSASLNYPPSFLWISFLVEDLNEQQKWELKAILDFTWYQSKTQDGKPDSLFNLGYCYDNGIGTDIDQNKAAKLYIEAAKRGFASAQCSLGSCYECGQGVPKDMKLAIKLYRKAAEQGLARARYHLGYCYQNGEGVPRDINKAMELYSKAAEQGYADAKNINFTHVNVNMQPIVDILKVNTAIKSFSLISNNIGDEGAQAIADALRINNKNSLTLVTLNSNNIGDEGAQAIADALKINNTITSLSLFGNNIKDEGAQAIADALKVNTAIKSFNLRRNNIKDEGAQAIADALKLNNTIKQLDIQRNNIKDEGAQAIADALKVNNSLTQLSFGGNNIGDEGAQAIADALRINNSLTSLVLSRNNIGNAGAQAIADALRVDQFTVKGLTNTNISNIEQALKMKKELLELDLSRRILQCCFLNSKDNKIGNKGINAIIEMLKVNNSLQRLDIFDNEFDDISKLGDSLKYNKSLTELVIKEDKSNVKELKKALQFNICLLSIKRSNYDLFQSETIEELLKRNKDIRKTLSERIFECKNAHLSLLDYKILERVNVAVIFKNVWKFHQTQQTGKSYEEYLREYWELISLNAFSKYFLFILGVCKPNQIPPSRSHLLGIPIEILDYISSFLNPLDFLESLQSIENRKPRIKETVDTITDRDPRIEETINTIDTITNRNQGIKEAVSKQEKKGCNGIGKSK